MFKIFVDTDMDFTPSDCAKDDLGLISMPIILDGQDVFPYEEGPLKTFDPKAFFNRLRGGYVPKTCGLSPEKYKSYFEPVLKEGKDILYIHFSEAMSGTFNAMRLAIEELKKTYPERKIEEVDTLAITSLARVIVQDVLPLYREGKSLEEVKEAVLKVRGHYAITLFADDLKFFKASGRVSGFSASVGGLLDIKPIISMTEDGFLKPIGKVLGRQAALTRIVKDLKEKGDEVEKHPFCIVHSDIVPDLLQFLHKRLKEAGLTSYEEIVVNPTAGSHAGPGCLGIAFHAKHR